MNIFGLIYLFILLISVNQDYIHASNFKKKYLDLTFKNKNFLNGTLLVQNDNNIKTIVVTGKGTSE